MANCDEGYICPVCGEEVKRLIDSSLYLQYVIGWIRADELHQTPDIHLRCNPSLSQFIESEEFPPITAEGPFDRRSLDANFVEQRVQLITRGYQRLRQLQRDRSLPIEQYPITSESS
jgi:hypothetical protein